MKQVKFVYLKLFWFKYNCLRESKNGILSIWKLKIYDIYLNLNGREFFYEYCYIKLCIFSQYMFCKVKQYVIYVFLNL